MPSNEPHVTCGGRHLRRNYGIRSLQMTSFIYERRIVQVDGGELVLLGPVILAVLPFGFVATLG